MCVCDYNMQHYLYSCTVITTLLPVMLPGDFCMRVCVGVVAMEMYEDAGNNGISMLLAVSTPFPLDL